MFSNWNFKKHSEINISPCTPLLYFIKFGLPGLSCTRFNRQNIMNLPCKPALHSWNMQDFFPVKKKIYMAKYFHSELCQTSKMVDFAEIIEKIVM